MSFGSEIKKLRGQRKLSQKEVADAVQVSVNTIVSWEKRPSGDGIYQRHYRKLAEVLGVTTDQLDSFAVIKRIPQTIGDPGRRGIPVINKAPAGRVVDYHECGPDTGIGRWYIERKDENDPNAFAVVITGDSMNKTLNEGDVVVFLPMDPDGYTHNGRVKIDDGHICYIRFSADSKHEGCTVAAVHRLADGRVKLVKENRKYPSITVQPHEIANLAAAGDIRRELLPGRIRMFEGRESNGGSERAVHPDYD